MLVVIHDHPNHGNEPPSLFCHACEDAGDQHLLHPPLHPHDLFKRYKQSPRIFSDIAQHCFAHFFLSDCARDCRPQRPQDQSVEM